MPSPKLGRLRSNAQVHPDHGCHEPALIRHVAPDVSLDHSRTNAVDNDLRPVLISTGVTEGVSRGWLDSHLLAIRPQSALGDFLDRVHDQELAVGVVGLLELPRGWPVFFVAETVQKSLLL